MKFLFLYLTLPLYLFASNWEYRLQVDPMTDLRSIFFSKLSERATPLQSKLEVSLVKGKVLMQVHFPQELKQEGSLLIRWDKEKAYILPVNYKTKKSVDIAVFDIINPFRKKSMIDKLNSHQVLLMQYINLKSEKVVVKFVLSGFSELFSKYASVQYQAFITKEKADRQLGHKEHTGKYSFARNGCGGCHSTKRHVRLKGPSLYKIKNRLSKEEIKQSIYNPNAVIAKGYSRDVMPALIMSNKELNEIVEYILGL